jgi:hypothetical protein
VRCGAGATKALEDLEEDVIRQGANAVLLAVRKNVWEPGEAGKEAPVATFHFELCASPRRQAEGRLKIRQQGGEKDRAWRRPETVWSWWGDDGGAGASRHLSKSISPLPPPPTLPMLRRHRAPFLATRNRCPHSREGGGGTAGAGVEGFFLAKVDLALVATGDLRKGLDGISCGGGGVPGMLGWAFSDTW